MTIEKRVNDWYAEHESDPEYQAELLSLLATEQIVRAMKDGGVTKADLARRMDVSKARITHLLNGTPNMTLKTMAAVATALGSRFDLRLSSKGEPWEKNAVVYQLIRPTFETASIRGQMSKITPEPISVPRRFTLDSTKEGKSEHPAA